MVGERVVGCHPLLFQVTFSVTLKEVDTKEHRYQTIFLYDKKDKACVCVCICIYLFMYVCRLVGR